MSQPEVAALTDQTAELAGSVIVIDVASMLHFIKCLTAEVTVRLGLHQTQDSGHVTSQTQHTDASTIKLRLMFLGVFTLPPTRSDLTQVSWDRSVAHLGVRGFAPATVRSGFRICARSDSESGDAQPAFAQRARTGLANGETAIPTKFSDGAFRTATRRTNVIGMVHHMYSTIGPICADGSIGPVCADAGF
jgi:hypothetical protein